MRWHVDAFEGINPARHSEKLGASLAVSCVNTLLDYGSIQGLEMPKRLRKAASSNTLRIAATVDGNVHESALPYFGVAQEVARKSFLTYRSDGVLGQYGAVKNFVTRPAAIAIGTVIGDQTSRRHTGSFQRIGALWSRYLANTADKTYHDKTIIHTGDGTFGDSEKLPRNLEGMLHSLDANGNTTASVLDPELIFTMFDKEDPNNGIDPNATPSGVEDPYTTDPDSPLYGSDWNGVLGNFASNGQDEELDTFRYPNLNEYASAQLNPNFIPVAYCITYIDIYGRESQPSDPVAFISPKFDSSLGEIVHVIGMPALDDDTIVSARVYRAVPNPHVKDDPTAGQSAFLPIGEADPRVAHYYVRTPIDVQGVMTLESQYYDPPPVDMKYLCELENGTLACVDTDGMGVRISMRHQWHAWPKRRRINLPYGSKIRDLKAKGETLYVLTSTGNYVVQTGQDAGIGGLRMEVKFVPAPAPIIEGVRAVVTDYGVAYCSEQGLVAIAGFQARMLTERLIPPNSWRNHMKPPKALGYHRGKLYLFRTDDCAIINLPDAIFGDTVDAVMVTATVAAVDCETTPTGEFILLCTDGFIYTWNPSNADPSTVWRYESAHVATRDRIHVTAGRVDGSFKGDLAVYADGLLFDTYAADGTAPHSTFRTSRGWATDHLHFTAEGSGELISVSLGSNLQAVSMATEG